MPISNGLKIAILPLLLWSVTSCKKELFIPDEKSPAVDSSSHHNGFPPNYDVVFNQNQVNRINIIFTPNEWQAMQTDLDQKSGGGPGSPPTEDPSYFECEVIFNGLSWNHVGIRYKGNSSLRARSNKLPLRFDFDQWEDQYPAIVDQRFYGFKELSMSSNYNDPAIMREKSAADLFRNFGVPAVRTAFYEVYIDEGTGTYQYYGMYTLTEIVFDTFLNDWFGSKSGNCYKPDGNGARFFSSNFTLTDFELKTKEVQYVKSGIQQVYDVLQSPTRATHPTQWKKDLEAVFDVDGFLKYLAVNNTIQNWDTYGKMTHNYYLYHDPKDDRIKWIVWDHNEAFQNGKMGGALSLGMQEVGVDWPLINYLIADETYETTYQGYLKQCIETSFASTRMQGIYSTQENLLQTAADNEETGYSYTNGQFNAAVQTLQNHNIDRIQAVTEYLQ